jgi:hypothetical protein
VGILAARSKSRRRVAQLDSSKSQGGGETAENKRLGISPLLICWAPVVTMDIGVAILRTKLQNLQGQLNAIVKTSGQLRSTFERHFHPDPVENLPSDEVRAAPPTA